MNKGDKVRIKEDTNIAKDDWFLLKCQNERVVGEVTEVAFDPYYKDYVNVSVKLSVGTASDHVLFHVEDLEIVE